MHLGNGRNDCHFQVVNDGDILETVAAVENGRPTLLPGCWVKANFDGNCIVCSRGQKEELGWYSVILFLTIGSCFLCLTGVE
ncbi:hypothetical protein LOK49_LG04G01513 [Camellia lanceoleosa]|uniref:Uncharacterized protein n=1 Tax=Camellia lanceoleosa TaxID=1840588 RepID=A0ACC0I1W1_9ERIC|nr:hypothetical protein LOK49_LG04G01513 [Camellia lanceoleosa]